MRYAFMLMGIATLILSVGAFFVFKNKTEAPVVITTHEEDMTLSLTSPAFLEGGRIPAKYTCDGENMSPELRIAGVPEGAKSLVLVMDDPDIPESAKARIGKDTWDHWVLYNIPPETAVLAKGSVAGNSGLNSGGDTGYAGPCPPDREHRYVFRLYALSGTLNFLTVPTLREVEDAAQGMMLEQTTLRGMYERINKK